MPGPELSVVMSVYNAGPALHACMDSLLSQEGCDFEIVAIDDGSTDGSGAVLDEYARRDPRVRVLHQENQGLTRALIRGCAAARGEFIARQDAEDVSLPGRFQAQCSLLRAHADVVAVASGLAFVAPGGEWMYDVLPEARIEPDLAGSSVSLPPLVAATFRRNAYLRAGGFREAFVVAQDVDLWLRLLDCGAGRGLPEVHYRAVFTRGGISGRRRPEQVRLVALALECARRRRRGEDDTELLAAPPSRQASRRAAAGNNAAFHYFVASCLRRHDPEAARRYYRLAIRENPLHLKALIRSILT